jgi:hypothetical protein
MYQSDKTEALIVMGLKAFSILLHFVSVHLEQSASTLKLKLIHVLAIIPWVATFVMTTLYLQKGGVCYDSGMESFWYKGRKIYPDGSAPVDGANCAITTLVNGTNVTEYQSFVLWDLDHGTASSMLVI